MEVDKVSNFSDRFSEIIYFFNRSKNEFHVCILNTYNFYIIEILELSEDKK